MRGASVCVILLSASFLAPSAASAQQARWPAPTPPALATAAVVPKPTQAPAPVAAAQPRCTNPNALGVARTVEIDTTGGPGFGFEHFKMHDFLRATRSC